MDASLLRSAVRRRCGSIRWFVTFALLGIVVAPAAARAGVVEIGLGPVRVRAYQLNVAVYPAQQGGRAIVIVSLTREVGRRVLLGGNGPRLPQFVESHTFEATHGVHVNLSRDFATGHVTARLGEYGRLDLQFTGVLQHASGCVAREHDGSATGVLRLTPGGRYFRTIRLLKLPSTVGLSHCQDNRDVRDDVRQQLVLTARSEHTPTVVIDTADAPTWTISYARPSREVLVGDEIQANAPPADALTASPELSSATVRAFGPFLRGTASYSATTTDANGATSGTLAGSLTALFDSPGPVPLVRPSLPATLGFLP